MSENPLVLPCPAEVLVPQRPPMMIISRLLERDLERNISVVEAVGPVSGIFNPDGKKIISELMIERFVNPRDEWYDSIRNINLKLAALEK